MFAASNAQDRSLAVRRVLAGLLVANIADAVEERLTNDLELEEVTVHIEPC